MTTLQDNVLRKLHEMNQYLSELADLMPSRKKEYLADIMRRRACEKTIETAIELVLDIISLIVSHQKLDLPESEDDLIEILKTKDIITTSLSKRLTEIKGFRNILVHRYGKIDDEKSYLFLTEELSDFSQFEKEIKKYLKSFNGSQ